MRYHGGSACRKAARDLEMANKGKTLELSNLRSLEEAPVARSQICEEAHCLVGAAVFARPP